MILFALHLFGLFHRGIVDAFGLRTPSGLRLRPSAFGLSWTAVDWNHRVVQNVVYIGPRIPKTALFIAIFSDRI